MHAPRLLRFAMVLALAGLAAGGRGEETMRYVYHPPESPLDRRYIYHWKILATALEATRGDFGGYTMEPSVQMTEKRQAFELRNHTGKLTVMYLSTVPEFERDLVPVRIPVDRNLGGYCVFLIRQDRSADFASVASLDDLRKFSYGLGLDWIDVGILEANRLRVVTGSSYEGLFEMLVAKRFDVFLRAAVEVVDEYEQRRAAMPELRIEDSLCLYYTLPMYFWFPRTPEGRRLAARAETGMRRMLDDGTYDRIFSEFQDGKIQRLDLKHRKIFRIENPNLGPETPLADKRLWFDPQTYHATP